jgi:hypothetical protein
VIIATSKLTAVNEAEDPGQGLSYPQDESSSSIGHHLPNQSLEQALDSFRPFFRNQYIEGTEEDSIVAFETAFGLLCDERERR